MCAQPSSYNPIVSASGTLLRDFLVDVVGYQQGSDDADLDAVEEPRSVPGPGLRAYRRCPAILNMVHPLLPARNMPRIPHIPRDRTGARANWGMRGMRGKISP
jgi:hypothetical protein